MPIGKSDQLEGGFGFILHEQHDEDAAGEVLLRGPDGRARRGGRVHARDTRAIQAPGYHIPRGGLLAGMAVDRSRGM